MTLEQIELHNKCVDEEIDFLEKQIDQVHTFDKAFGEINDRIRELKYHYLDPDDAED